MPSTYALDNRAPTAADHHSGLAQLLDPFTQRRIQHLAPTPHGWAGARVLEVGAGHGSIALWLADQVGPRGKVIALDLHPDYIPPHPRIRRLAYDLTRDEPLTRRLGDLDLIHARLTLAHLPDRERILHRLASTLTPGGVILIEDWAVQDQGTVIAAPTQADSTLHTLVQRNLAVVLEAAGSDRTWAKAIHAAMLSQGLEQVETLVHASFWNGGGPGTRMLGAILTHLWDQLLATGMTADQLNRERELLNDPRLVLHGHPLYSTSGRRPH